MEANPYLSPETAGHIEADEYRPASLLVPVISILLGLQALLLLVMASLVAWFSPGLEQPAPQQLHPLVIFVTVLTGLALMVSYIASAVLFLVWIHRANGNAWALGAKGLEFTGGRCVISFFIPFFNFFRPYQAVREIYQASEPGADPLDWVMTPGSWLVRIWWAFWVGAALLGTVTFFAGQAVWTPPVRIAYSLMEAAAAVFAMGVIWSIHARQQERARRRTNVGNAGAA